MRTTREKMRLMLNDTKAIVDDWQRTCTEMFRRKKIRTSIMILKITDKLYINKNFKTYIDTLRQRGHVFACD